MVASTSLTAPRTGHVDRRARAHALAAFFAAGATLSATVVALPGWPDLDRPGILITVVLAAGGASILRWGSDRIGDRSIHTFTATGTLLIGACQVLAGGGSASAMYAMLYIWVILHCSLFASARAVAGHLVLTTATHAAALLSIGETDALAPQLTLTLGTQLAAALVIGPLARQQRALAETDTLTGLGNRRVAERSLDLAIAASRRDPSRQTWVAMFDLDGFKAFNDRLGHAAGDRALVAVAAGWHELVRGTDTLARVGGDEFVVVLAGCSAADAVAVVDRMLDRLPQGFGCSAGLVRWDGTESPQELLERADRELYVAKGSDARRSIADPVGLTSPRPPAAR